MLTNYVTNVLCAIVLFRYAGVVLYSMSDIPLGFGVAAYSTNDCRKVDATAVVAFHQSDIGEYLRIEDSSNVAEQADETVTKQFNRRKRAHNSDDNDNNDDDDNDQTTHVNKKQQYNKSNQQNGHKNQQRNTNKQHNNNKSRSFANNKQSNKT